MISRWRPLRQVRRALLVASALSAGIGMLMLAVPLFVLQLFGAVLPTGSNEHLLWIAAILAAVICVVLVVDACRRLILLRTGLWLDHVIGEALLGAGLAQGATGETLLQRANAIARLRAALVGGWLPHVLELPCAIAACALVSVLHPGLAVVSAAALGLMLLCYLAAASRRGPDAVQNDDSARWLTAISRHCGQVARDGRAEAVAGHWEHANRRRIAVAYRQGRRKGFAMAAAQAVRVAGSAGVMAFGIGLSIAGELSPGAAIAAAFVVSRALAAAERTIAHREDIRGAVLAWRQLGAATSNMPVRDSKRVSSADGHPGRIVLKNATCTFTGSTQPVLIDATLTIEPGECVGIIGPAGSGKSALAATIAGDLVPVSGSASLGDGAIAKRQLSWPSGRCIGYLADNPYLLRGSVADNICGFDGATGADALAASLRSGVSEILAALPQGLLTKIGDDGSGLSFRQRRAVAIARAFSGTPGYVVLDEPELGFDEAARAQLVQAIEALVRQQVGVVVATSDPRILALTHRIVLMEAGRIEAVVPSRQVASVQAGMRHNAAANAERRAA